jgi:hypothetical protein
MTGEDERTGSMIGRRSVPERAWIIIAIVLVGALVLLITAALMVPERASDIWVNLAGSAAQIVVLALAGGVVGAVLRDREARREDARRRADALATFQSEVDAAFSEIKAARRTLRMRSARSRMMSRAFPPPAAATVFNAAASVAPARSCASRAA